MCKFGFPDQGNGWYSKVLTYKDWYQFNNAKRASSNFFEIFPVIAIFTIVCGLTLPLPAAVLCFVFSFGRLFYAIGYKCKGPAGRVPGAIFGSLSMLGLMGTAIYCIVIQLIG